MKAYPSRETYPDSQSCDWRCKDKQLFPFLATILLFFSKNLVMMIANSQSVYVSRDCSKLIVVKTGFSKHQFARWKEAIVPPNLPRISKFGGTFSFRNHFLNSQMPGQNTTFVKNLTFCLFKNVKNRKMFARSLIFWTCRWKGKTSPPASWTPNRQSWRSCTAVFGF